MIFDQNFILSLIVALFVGGVAGYLGSVIILRRLALVGDALSHVALPGIGIALVFNLNPFLLAFIFLAVSTLIIWVLENKTKIPLEALVGILFTAALALGILITPEIELAEALFGDISKINFLDGVLTIILSILIIFVGRKIYKKLILGVISEDLAVSSGIKIKRIDLIFLILISIIVALGVKVVGTLLMGALVIIPAAGARNLSRGIKTYSFLSSVFGSFSALSGVFLAKFFNFPPGPVVVLIGVFIFLLSLLKIRK